VTSALFQTSRPGSLPALFGLALLLTAGCSPDAEPVSKKPLRAAGGHLVTTVVTERAPVSTRHARPGSLRLRRQARLYSQEEGRIVALDVYEGDRVEQGQIIVRLEDDLLRAEHEKARTVVRQEQLDLERLTDLQTRGAASDDEVAQARTALAIAEAEERILATRLAYTRIHAPFTGIITERLVDPGDFVAKNSHLLTLADPASLIAEAAVSELVLPHIRVGDPVTVRIDALGGQRSPGSILRIHPTLSEASRQALVEVRFEQIPAGARAGQFVRVELGTAAVPRLLVPFRALRRDRDGAFVWVVDSDGRAERRSVETGQRIADGVEILDGLDAGESVVTGGFLGLAAGKAVTPVGADSGEAD
jgi:RND family efflux transporter MFP subunit